MHPGGVAARAPDRVAVLHEPGGEAVTYRELDEASIRFANVLRNNGLAAGDSIAVLMDNGPCFHQVSWGAKRAGLYYTPINPHLTLGEAAYIISDSGASVLVASASLADVAGRLDPETVPAVTLRLSVGGAIDGYQLFEDTIARQPATPTALEGEGEPLPYSSGTTGRPKGVRRPISFAPLGEGPDGVVPIFRNLGLEDGGVYLSPAPLHHSAPLLFTMAAQRLGTTVVQMERFDAEQALALIERHHVNVTQMVPTMFIRMLKLPAEVRARYDLSSLRAVVHAAAPCPPEVKAEMLDWLGPIVYEYYSSSEGAGATFITPEEARQRPGSVGRAMLGTIHVLDDDGDAVPAGEVGTIWFSGGWDFEYHGDPVKTADAKDRSGRATVGDVGYVDDDGYLYLTDRRSFMIISGGVNVYPQEVENLLVLHPTVLDVAVFGVPDPDLGEHVLAVVQPVDWADAGPELEAELLAHCRQNLATIKCPRKIDFQPSLPRLDNGKLYKRVLRDRYWPEPAAVSGYES